MSRYTPRSSTSSVKGGSLKGKPQVSDYEEFASLQLDKPSEGELRTTEEMKRHMLDDHFEGRPVDRALHILTLGEEVQKISVIRDLHTLIRTDEQGCLLRIIPKVQTALNAATTEFHIEAARAYFVLLEKKTVSPNVFANSFLGSIIYHLDNRDQVVSSAWLNTLIKATEVLPIEIVRSSILPVAINKGQISQSVWQRLTACKMLGKMCLRFDSQTVKKDLLPVVLSLCQDVNEAVRACICSQLYLVAKGIPSDMLKPALIPILVELGRDETVQVRVEATETIVKIMPSLSQEVLKVTIIPLIKKICEQAALATDETLLMVSKQFGSICIGLESLYCFTDTLAHSEKIWMVTYYDNLSHLGIPVHGPKKDSFFTSHTMDRLNARYIECRQNCAYNFPAMAKFCSSSSELLEKLYPSLCNFSTDPYYMVRKTIGAGMHEVAKILGSNNRIVKNQVMTLLWDNMEEVLVGIVPHLGRTIECLILSGVLGQDQDGASLELGRGLLQCDKTIRDKTHNWRLYTDFITQLESVVKCLPSDYIYSHFVSLMFDKMHRARPLPCRMAAARTLLVFLRYNLKSNQRQEILTRLQSEFCLSASCYKRMLFLRLCNMAQEIFSRNFFKEHFFFPLLSRSEDKVANNRLILVRQLPALKAMIIMPSEKKYLQTLETCLRSMALTEKDRDVVAELRLTIHRLDKIETLSENPATQTPEDLEDKKKLEEETRVENMIGRQGVGFQVLTGDNRRVPREPKSLPKPSEGRPATTMPNSGASTASGNPSVSPRGDRPGFPPGHSVASSSSSYGSGNLPSPQGIYQPYTNPTNSIHSVRSLSTHLTNIDQNCTCFSTANFRSENLRNLNLLALIDTSLVNSKQKLSEALRQKLLEDPRIKLRKSSKRSMEISWLNLETDLKNELFALSKNRQIQGDRNFKEKSKFLTDFRNYNESTLRKFISDDREHKETIYNVTGFGGGYQERTSNFFEERINFFERRIKSEDQKPNPTLSDCSCFELTTNWEKPFDEFNKFSYFSKNFEEDFYRDAGVKANEIICKKFSGIPVQEKSTTQISTPKLSTSVTNKRRTWFGNENSVPETVKLETITGYKPKNCERKKSESLPAKESVSLKKLGIGPRSKSFVLPSTLIYSDKQTSDCQSTKLVFDKDKEAKQLEIESSEQNPRTEPSANRFGFRAKTTPKIEPKDKTITRKKIPVSTIGSGNSLGSNLGKPEAGVKPQMNGTKKIPVVISRKSMLIQSSLVKSDLKNNRRSLDPSKINLEHLDKPLGLRRRQEKTGGKEKGGSENSLGGGNGEKEEVEATCSGNLSKLPVRRPKPDK